MSVGAPGATAAAANPAHLLLLQMRSKGSTSVGDAVDMLQKSQQKISITKKADGAVKKELAKAGGRQADQQEGKQETPPKRSTPAAAKRTAKKSRKAQAAVHRDTEETQLAMEGQVHL